MKKLAVAAFMFGLFGVIGLASAAGQKKDPTGTWKWTTKFGEKEIERTMKLEVKDGKVTGTVSGFGKGGDNKIDEGGTYKDGELKFNVTREGKGGEKTTSKYAGKYDEKADTIKLKITSTFGGKDVEQEAEAKRAKDEKKKD